MEHHFKRILISLCLTLLFFTCVYSQSGDSYKLGFKDYHSTPILDIKLFKNKKYIITSDSDGKVVLFDAITFDYVKTIKTPNNIPISSISPIKNDSILVMSQSYPSGLNSVSDTLILKSLFTDQHYNQQGSIQFPNLDIEDSFGNINYDTSRREYLFELSRNDATRQFTVPVGWIAPKIIAVSHDYKKVAYAKPNIPRINDIIICDAVNSQTQQRKITIPEGLDILSLFFDKSTYDLYAVTLNTDTEKFSIYNIRNHSFESPAYTIDYPGLGDEKVISSYDGNQHILTTLSLYTRPRVILRNGDTFTHQELQLRGGVTNAVINADRDEIIYVNGSNMKSIKDFSVYNYTSKQITNTFPKFTNSFYSNVYLPDNSWVATTATTENNRFYDNIKYFEAGTFNNRFHTLNFNNYLASHHKLNLVDAHLIAKDGIAVVYGSTNVQDYANYYSYDFAKDKISQLTNSKLNLLNLQDYNSNKKILLLADGYYTNQGHTESIRLELFQDNKITVIKGNYKFGKISNDGNYLLTISDKNLLEIKSIEKLNVIFTQELQEGNYTLHSIENSSFMVSNDYRYRKANDCNRETIIFEIENNAVKINNIACAVISNISQNGENIGFVLENYGIAINNKTLPFTKSQFPQIMSFNNDGSKFMLSFNNGKNAIYDTKTMQPLVYMIHPDSKSHIFSDVNHNYFSNIDPEQFLFASKNGKTVKIDEIEKTHFNPEKILELFGVPNKNYLTALRKAIDLRNTNYVNTDNFDYQQNTTEEVISSNVNLDTKPNLYLLSIGVSNYKDPSYNLTFSDKDAIDITRIYGALDQQQINAYNRKFYGKKYILYDQDNKPIKTINNYTGPYHSTGYKYLLNTAGTIWLEDLNGKHALWNYNDNTIDSIILPETVDKSVYSDFGKSIFIKPNDDGFYLKTNDGLLEYTFKTKRFIPISLPFQPTKINFIPLENNRWLHFDDGYFQNKGLTISIGTFYGDTSPKTYSLQFENSKKIIREIATNGSIRIDTIYNYAKELKAVSENGRYVLYTMGTDKVYYIDLHQNEIIPTQLPIDKESVSNCEISVANDGSQFFIIETLHDLEKKRITYYDLSGKVLKTKEYDLNFRNDGIVNNGESYYYIKGEEGLLSKGYFDELDDLLDKYQPYTFENVYSKYFINEQATAKSIIDELKSFFAQATPNDQIMIFLAGHGVLDSNNNYYYAPHDMDFEKVSNYGVSFAAITESLQKSPAANKLLIMDTCHSGKTIDLDSNSSNTTSEKQHDTGSRGSRVMVGTKPKYKVSDVISSLFEDFLSKSDITIISASSGGDLAQEHSDWGNGAFTSSYLKLLKSKMGTIVGTFMLGEPNTKQSIVLDEKFIDDLYKEVFDLTKGKQIPDLREFNKKAKISIW